jgi:hypothetical protein
MAPPIILEDQEDIYHYLVVMKEHLNHSYFSSIGEVPVSVIDLRSTSTHASGTGFLGALGNSTHPDIHEFLCASGILTPPGDTFDFNYLTNYPGVSSQGTILSTAASSLGSASSLIFSSNTPTNINFNVMTISGLNNPKYYFIEVNGGINKFNGNIDSVFDYNYFVSVNSKINQYISYFTIDGNYEITNTSLGKKLNYSFEVASKYLYRDVYKQYPIVDNIGESFQITPTMYFNDVSSSNGIRVSSTISETGDIKLEHYYLKSNTTTPTVLASKNSLPIKPQSIDCLIANCLLTGDYYFYSNPNTLKNNLITEGARTSIYVNASSNLSTSSFDIPKVQITNRGSLLQSEFLNLMINFTQASDVDSTLTLANFINKELAKQGNFYNAIISDLFKTSGASTILT